MAAGVRQRSPHEARNATWSRFEGQLRLAVACATAPGDRMRSMRWRWCSEGRGNVSAACRILVHSIVVASS